MKKKSKKFDIITMLLLMAIVAVSAAIVLILLPYAKSRKAYHDLQTGYVKSSTTGKELLNTAAEETPDDSLTAGNLHESIDFAALKALNQDCNSWIIACDGKINYPVVKASDDSYYLRRGLDGSSLYSGTVFIRSDIERPYEQFITAIYGHNMKDGSMFHELLSYKEETYFKENPYVLILTPEEDLVFRVFAVNVMDESKIPVPEGDDEEARSAFLEEVMSRTPYDTKVTAGPNDAIIELITCEYSGKNNRIVVYAKREEQ